VLGNLHDLRRPYAKLKTDAEMLLADFVSQAGHTGPSRPAISRSPAPTDAVCRGQLLLRVRSHTVDTRICRTQERRYAEITPTDAASPRQKKTPQSSGLAELRGKVLAQGRLSTPPFVDEHMSGQTRRLVARRPDRALGRQATIGNCGRLHRPYVRGVFNVNRMALSHWEHYSLPGEPMPLVQCRRSFNAPISLSFRLQSLLPKVPLCFHGLRRPNRLMLSVGRYDA
jgi:hypothetical protein